MPTGRGDPQPSLSTYLQQHKEPEEAGAGPRGPPPAAAGHRGGRRPRPAGAAGQRGLLLLCPLAPRLYPSPPSARLQAVPGNGELRQHQAAGGGADLPAERRILPPPAPFIWGLRRGGGGGGGEEGGEGRGGGGGECLPSQEFGRPRRSLHGKGWQSRLSAAGVPSPRRERPQPPAEGEGWEPAATALALPAPPYPAGSTPRPRLSPSPNSISSPGAGKARRQEKQRGKQKRVFTTTPEYSQQFHPNVIFPACLPRPDQGTREGAAGGAENGGVLTHPEQTRPRTGL